MTGLSAQVKGLSEVPGNLIFNITPRGVTPHKQRSDLGIDAATLGAAAIDSYAELASRHSGDNAVHVQYAQALARSSIYSGAAKERCPKALRQKEGTDDSLRGARISRSV